MNEKKQPVAGVDYQDNPVRVGEALQIPRLVGMEFDCVITSITESVITIKAVRRDAEVKGR